MGSIWGINRAAVNTGYGMPKTCRGGETVCPWLPTDMKMRRKITTSRAGGSSILKKGSAEAKERMAYLRSLRGHGGGKRRTKKSGLKGGSDFWDSYTNAALLGGDMDWDSYTNAALRGGSPVETSPSTGGLSGILSALGPALISSLTSAATQQGEKALSYISDPNNMTALLSTLAPMAVSGVSAAVKKIQGGPPDESKDPMGFLRYLKQHDPAAYTSKIAEIRAQMGK